MATTSWRSLVNRLWQASPSRPSATSYRHHLCRPRPRLLSAQLSTSAPPRLILGIESSCDDSCASVVSSDRRILSSVVTKQDHSETHGIHPLVAAVGHHRNMPSTIARAIDDAGLRHDDLHGIAVTLGPGMKGSLAVGLTAAKTLAAVLRKPLVYVHHMQAHALTPLLTEPDPPQFPFLTLLVSGGHTLLLLARSETDFSILASTGDDSIGDAYDKVARDLAVPWTSAPGAALEAFCSPTPTDTEASSTEPAVAFPIPQRGKPAFSYSGLKSAVRRHIVEAGGTPNLDERQRRRIGQAFQRAACAQLEDKIKLALRPLQQRRRANSIETHPNYIDLGVDPKSIRSLVCSGGVAANLFLRSRLRVALDSIDRSDVQLCFPPLPLCTDNAAMIAFTGHVLWHQRTDDYTPHSRAKWSLEDL